MKKLLSGLLATSLAASFAIASVVPVNATPVFVPKADTAQTDVQNVQYQPWRRLNRMDRRIDRRIDRRVDRRLNRQRGAQRNGYYNGYRGYRDYHHGYRRHGDFWYPAAAFLAGALITGAIVNNNARATAAIRMCRGAMTATGPTGSTTTRSIQGETDRASSAIRPMIEV